MLVVTQKPLLEDVVNHGVVVYEDWVIGSNGDIAHCSRVVELWDPAEVSNPKDNVNLV